MHNYMITNNSSNIFNHTLKMPAVVKELTLEIGMENNPTCFLCVGEDEAPPAKRCKEDAPESKEVRRVSTRAMLLQDKKRQKEEEQEMREEKLRKDGERTAVVRLKRLQQAALKHSSPRIDKSLLAAGREVRMESHANSTEQLKPASPEPPDQSIE